MSDLKVILPGGAGLVGQNLVARLKEKGYSNIVVLDKHKKNLEVLKSVHPDVTVQHVDLSKKGEWLQCFDDADVVVMLQAQIGGIYYDEFVRNNVSTSKIILEKIKSLDVPPYLVHISSSVIESAADDFYTRTKIEQENLVLASEIDCPILRPTLMFGWFDRKHLGWLSRFMKKVPVFPIPGNGKYMRQPLYVGDFCNIIISCIEKKVGKAIYNISGHEQVNYIDIIKQIKVATNAKSMIIKVPYTFFYSLLWCWALVDKKPPFTTQQLEALITEDEFEVIDWPGVFNVKCTPFSEALRETFNHPTYSKVALEF